MSKTGRARRTPEERIAKRNQRSTEGTIMRIIKGAAVSETTAAEESVKVFANNRDAKRKRAAK